MPKVNTETVHNVELTQGDIDRLENGRSIAVELDNGSTLQLTGPGQSSGGASDESLVEAALNESPAAVAEDRENVSEDDVKQLVNEAQKESGNASLVEKNPDKPDNVEKA